MDDPTLKDLIQEVHCGDGVIAQELIKVNAWMREFQPFVYNTTDLSYANIGVWAIFVLLLVHVIRHW